MKVINIQIESPSQLGKDRLADAIGALCYYGAPAIVIDMGTATTIGVIDEKGDFIGGMIMPGVKTSLKALSTKASQLPTINIEKPRHFIGRNTLECMQSGIIYGTASMIDGMIDRIIPTLGKDVKIIATGGNAHYVISYCKHNIIVDKYLQFKGIMKAVTQENEE
jgi:type III pantothenate kinase